MGYSGIPYNESKISFIGSNDSHWLNQAHWLVSLAFTENHHNNIHSPHTHHINKMTINWYSKKQHTEAFNTQLGLVMDEMRTLIN